MQTISNKFVRYLKKSERSVAASQSSFSSFVSKSAGISSIRKSAYIAEIKLAGLFAEHSIPFRLF